MVSRRLRGRSGVYLHHIDLGESVTRLFEAKPFIIAEVGSNWRSLGDCLRSIEVAKECGADAVKFQAFSRRALYGFENGDGSSEYVLPLVWLPALKEYADAEGIELMCTAFSPELVADVDAYVSVHKVASSDCCWPQMLEAVARTGKPVLISLGATDKHDIQRILHQNIERAVYMECQAAYPSDCASRQLENVEDWIQEIGFSDHTLGYTATVEAAKRGAIAIEKHFTAFPDLGTPDRPHSLTPDQFKAMVHLIRTGEAPDQEREFRLKHKRRLIATTDIPQGGILRYGESFGAYRSLEPDTRGLSPFRWEEVEGKTATKTIKRGTPIGEGDYE